MRTYGIDASALLKDHATGVEKYVINLLGAMMRESLFPEEEVILYARKSKPAALVLPERWHWKELSFFLPKGWTHLRLSAELTLNSPSVFFSPAHEIPYFYGRAAVVTTVHDVAFRRFPESYDSSNRARQEWAINRVKKLAKRVLTVSETTRADLREFFAFDLSRVTVTPLAPTFRERASEEEIERVLKAYKLPREHYVLFVGRVEEKKNIRTLVQAFLTLKERLGQGHPLKLVLAGSRGFGAREVDELVRDSSYGKDVYFLGYVPDRDVAPLLAGSQMFVMPSHWEGFGLPVLEAMVAETPVIASDIPVFREIGGEAVTLVPSMHIEGFAKAMENIVFHPEARSGMVAKGKIHVQKFSWEETARRTWEVLRSA